MSVSKYKYEPEKCDGQPCVGDCDFCGKANNSYCHDALVDWERVNHPKHYTDGRIEVIDFIEDKKLPYHLGNVIKYVCRAGKKDPLKEVEDLQKAQWYLERYIEMKRGKQ